MEGKREGDKIYDGSDEFFGSDAEQDDNSEQSDSMAAREIAALSARLRTLGYQDGVEAGVEEAVQEGFDRGYVNGATAGWEVGLLYGGAAGIAAVLAQSAAREMRVADPGRADSSAEYAVPPSSSSSSSSSGNKDNNIAGSIRLTPNPANNLSESERDVLGGVNDAGHCSDGGGRNMQADKLAEELREAALLGPDGPKVSKERVLGDFRRLGSAGAAVANRLAEQESR